MRIGINLLYLQPGVVGGTETYVRELVAEFASFQEHFFVLFCNLETVPTFSETNNIKIVKVTNKPFSQWGRFFCENLKMNRILQEYPVDILFSPSGIASPFLLNCVPQVCTVHDLQHLHLKQYFSLTKRIVRSFFYSTSYWRCKHIIAISDFTKNDLIEKFSISSSLITRVHHGFALDGFVVSDEEKQRVREKYKLFNRFFYYPAAMRQNKNHLKLIHYFSEIRKGDFQNIDLVFTGAKGEMQNQVQKTVDNLKLQKCIHLLGYVDRRDVFALMALSEAVLFPSDFEGFGFPILEAMGCGVPVISSNKTSLPEIAGCAAILLDPNDKAAWICAMEKLLNDPETRANMVRKGYQNLINFSWNKCAEQTLHVFHEIANKR